MDLKLFGKKIDLSILISVITLCIVLFTTYSCCHSKDVLESMTGSQSNETISNTQTKMPGTVINVGQPTPETTTMQQTAPTAIPQHIHSVPEHAHAPSAGNGAGNGAGNAGKLPFNLNIHLKDKKKKGNSTTEQASSTNSSTSGDCSTEGFSTLDGTTESSWMADAVGYASGMNNEDNTNARFGDTYSAENWTPDHTMAMFSNNAKKASCCATSAYSVNGACPCITSDQFNYLSSRGGNHSNGDI